MRLSLFDSFADMIDTIPVGAITRTLEREQRMLQEDLDYQRPVPLKDVGSILNFCRFVEAVREGLPGCVFTAPIPPAHTQFYRKTLERLIAVEELPFDAKAEFDSVLAGNRLEPMHAA